GTPGRARAGPESIVGFAAGGTAACFIATGASGQAVGRRSRVRGAGRHPFPASLSPRRRPAQRGAWLPSRPGARTTGVGGGRPALNEGSSRTRLAGITPQSTTQPFAKLLDAAVKPLPVALSQLALQDLAVRVPG